MKACFRIAAALAAFGLLAACGGQNRRAAARDSVETVEADGFAPYNAKDLAACSAAAAADAQKSAIEAAAGLFISPSARAEEYEPAKQDLFRTPRLFVKKHKVLFERREGDSLHVRIRAYIYIEKVAAAVKGPGTADARGRGASCAVMLDEYLGSAISSYGDAGKALSEHLSRKSSLKPVALQAMGNPGDENLFFEAARASGADFVLIGRAEAAPLSAQVRQSGFYAARARAELKVYETGSRKPLSEVSAQSNGLDVSEEGAFRKALASAGELLGRELSAKAGQFVKPAAAVTVRVKGLRDIAVAGRLKSAVERLDIDSADFDSYYGGEAVITVYPKRPDAQELASSLLKTGVLELQLDSVGQSEAEFSVIR